MSDAPEILWLWPAEPEDGVDKFVSFPGQRYPSGSTTYIRADVVRADLSDALLREAMEVLGKLHHAVCGETGFAQCVRDHSKTIYPWPALDVADHAARATLAKLRAHLGEKE